MPVANARTDRVQHQPCTYVAPVIVVLILTSLPIAILAEDVEGSHVLESSAMRALLIVPPFAGHLMPFIALGEKLVRRGHNVTLVSAPTDFIQRKVEEANINLWSIVEGSVGAHEMKEEMHKTLNTKNTKNNLQDLLEVSANFQENVLRTIDNSAVTSFNIIVGDTAFCLFLQCFSRKWNIPGIGLLPSLSLSPFDIHAWSFPPLMSGYSDNLSFYQRLVSTINNKLTALIVSKILTPTYFASVVGEFCKTTNISLDQMMHFSDYFPLIISTSIGFEFPRTLFPLIEYVGPILSQSPPQLPQDIAEWLDSREPRSVVYVSMGSLTALTDAQAETIVNGATQANFSVVWSLRKTNQHILDHMTYDTDNVLISDWVPQLTLLRHLSINSAILHGGLGGIQEALSCGIPIIVIPFFADQYDNAARVQYHHYGERIYQHELTTPLVTQTLRLIDSELYRKSIQKLQRIFKKDGGVSRVADLVEFYSEVGYEHLVPAYAKYNWSWVEFYNIDVYTVLILAVLLLSYLLYRLIRYCCSAVFSRAKKKEE